MRKVMLLAAMLAMVLAAAAPAFAQATIEGDEAQYIDCSQVQIALAVQGQYGDANAAAADGSEASAEIAQDLGITQTQVNACLGDIIIDGGDGAPAPEPPSGGSPAPDGSAAPSAPVASGGELPETGGASPLALGAGALLVAGGLVARRIVR